MTDTATTTSTKMQLHEDGTISVPIRDGEQTREIRLREPTMTELATISDLVAAADDAYNAQTEEGEDRTDREKNMLIRGPESPYGNAFIEIVRMLSGETVDRDQLYGWASGSMPCSLLLAHFTAPLDGAALVREAAKFAAMVGSQRNGSRSAVGS